MKMHLPFDCPLAGAPNADANALSVTNCPPLKPFCELTAAHEFVCAGRGGMTGAVAAVGDAKGLAAN